MNVLVIGSGGREHALAWKLAQSNKVHSVFCAPGNGGTRAVAQNLAIDPMDFDALLHAVDKHRIDLTVVGPEDPLCSGIVDVFEAAGKRIFGPSKEAARLEGDKAYAKSIMRQAAIPTAEARIFENYDQARDYVASREHGVVVKASGLAKGKGVVVCEDPADGLRALEDIMVGKRFGAAGDTVVVEELLRGQEISLQAIVDGRSIYLLEPAQDYKRLLEGDGGPNTGGMGAFSPAPLDEALLRQIYAEILVPTVDALRRQEITYKGVLYAGLMLTAGGPKVLEFNCRFGDPETQPTMARLKTDLVDILVAAIDGQLDQLAIDWKSEAAVCVVVAADGYPEAYRKGLSIKDVPPNESGLVTFHAGTRWQNDRLVSSGGRVLGVTGMGIDLEAARQRCYAGVEMMTLDGFTYRPDIAVKNV